MNEERKQCSENEGSKFLNELGEISATGIVWSCTQKARYKVTLTTVRKYFVRGEEENILSLFPAP